MSACRSWSLPRPPSCRYGEGGTRPRRRSHEAGLPHGRTFILRVLLVALGIILVAVLATRATEVKERWLQPILFLLPLALMILVEPRLNRLRETLLIAISAGIGIILMAAMAVGYLLPDLHGGPFRATAPFGALAEDIRRLGFDQGYVLAADHYIAGNLGLHLPGSHGGRARIRAVAARRREEARVGAPRLARQAATGRPRRSGRCSGGSAAPTRSVNSR